MRRRNALRLLRPTSLIPDYGTAKVRSLPPGCEPDAPPRGNAPPAPVAKQDQRASGILALLFIVLFVEPDAIDHQLSRVFFLNIDDGHRRAAGSAANSITDLEIVFIRHRFLQCSPMGREFCLRVGQCIVFRARGTLKW